MSPKILSQIECPPDFGVAFRISNQEHRRKKFFLQGHQLQINNEFLEMSFIPIIFSWKSDYNLLLRVIFQHRKNKVSHASLGIEAACPVPVFDSQG